MARPTEAHVHIAQRMLAGLGAGAGDSDARAAAAGRVYDALFGSLAPVLGAAAVRALLARSVKLTKADFPTLCEAMAAGPLENNPRVAQQLVTCLSKLEPAVALAAATALYATLFGLVATFIGEELMWQIVKSAFPDEPRTGSEETK
jgi:hypothetical protein